MAKSKPAGPGDNGEVGATPPPAGLSARAKLMLDRVGSRPGDASGCVAVIVDIMAAGEWVTGMTGRLLAECWQTPYSTIRSYAAEASRFFDVPEEERAAKRALWYAKLEADQARCREMGRMEALGTFMKLEADALGTLEPQKVELSGSLSDLLGSALKPDSGAAAEPVDE